MINGLQIKLARTALGWGVRELASKANVSFNTVSRFENGSGVHGRTIQALQTTLEDAGIIFIEEGAQSLDGGAGVRLKG
ncbi:helix-turn-helix domain-containing protein [Terasakiella sp.]|uniref:helix-turn-helix domain-containing protein n=1 Tax=Terasakiella sp. TaxID=2034861 RepID=UPI003AA8E6EC